MHASRTFNKILQEIQSSNLNFQLQLSPFSAQISLKKSLVKERDGSLRLPPIISSLPCKDSELEEIRSYAKMLEKELETIRHNYEQVVDDRKEAYEKIKILEDFINKPVKSERDPEVFEGLVDEIASLKNESSILEEENTALKNGISDLKKSEAVKVKVSERLKK